MFLIKTCAKHPPTHQIMSALKPIACVRTRLSGVVTDTKAFHDGLTSMLKNGRITYLADWESAADHINIINNTEHIRTLQKGNPALNATYTDFVRTILEIIGDETISWSKKMNLKEKTTCRRRGDKAEEHAKTHSERMVQEIEEGVNGAIRAGDEYRPTNIAHQSLGGHVHPTNA